MIHNITKKLQVQTPIQYRTIDDWNQSPTTQTGTSHHLNTTNTHTDLEILQYFGNSVHSILHHYLLLLFLDIHVFTYLYMFLMYFHMYCVSFDKYDFCKSRAVCTHKTKEWLTCLNNTFALSIIVFGKLILSAMLLISRKAFMRARSELLICERQWKVKTNIKYETNKSTEQF